MTISLAILLLPQFVTSAANDFSLPTIERGRYCLIAYERGWTDGETTSAMYLSRARGALLDSLGSKDLAERNRQREIFKRIGWCLSPRERAKVEQELGAEGFF